MELYTFSRPCLDDGRSARPVVVNLTYNYVVPTRYLTKLAEIKQETSVGIARQISFALELYLKEYEERPAFRDDLLAYVKGLERGGKPNQKE